MRPHVFMGGVPGAGKTTLAERVAASTGRFVRVGAGQLIRAALREAAESRVRVLDAMNARNNQLLLVSAFEAYSRDAGLPILLDGHFIVPTERGPDRVADEVFSALGIDALVVITALPDVIAARLAAREDRARWWAGTTAELQAMQEQEIEAAERVARLLSVPLNVSAALTEAQLLALFDRQSPGS